MERDKFKQAEEKWNETKGERDRFSGQLDQKVRNAEQQQRDIDAMDVEIKKSAKEARMDLEQDLLGQIQAAQNVLSSRKTDLEARQSRLTQIGEKLTALSEERRPLEQTRDAARKKWQDALTEVTRNMDNIADYGRLKADLEQERNTLKEELAADLASFYPDWTADLDKVKASLKNDANEYDQKAKAAFSARSELATTEQQIKTIEACRKSILGHFPDWDKSVEPISHPSADIVQEWTILNSGVGSAHTAIHQHNEDIATYKNVLEDWYESTGRDEAALDAIEASKPKLESYRKFVKTTDEQYRDFNKALTDAQKDKGDAMEDLGIKDESEVPVLEDLKTQQSNLSKAHDEIVAHRTEIKTKLDDDQDNHDKLDEKKEALAAAEADFNKWDPINRHFGGSRFRTVVQTYILRPLLNNANIYLKEITDRYKLTCSEDNEQLAILVQDRYNKDQIRSVTVLSGGERFMISLALSLALSSLNRPDMNVNILFIDEGFGTLDKTSLESVMATLEKLQEIAGQSNRRVGIISHREELDERIPTQIRVIKKGEGRSKVKIVTGA